MNTELAKDYFLKGIQEMNQGLLVEAETSFRRSLEIVPERESTLTNLSAVLLKLKKYEQAQQLALKLVTTNELNHPAWLNLGLARYELHQYPEALTAYDRALAIQPDYAEAWTNRGTALQALQQYELSLAAYDQALQFKPDLADAWSNRGSTLHELKQYEQAVASYDKAICIDPQFAQAWSNRGNALQELKQYEASLASYDKAISLQPDYAEAWSNRGRALGYMCQFELAEASYRQAIRINPDYLIAQSNLLFALNYLQSSAPEAALLEAQRYGAIVSPKSSPKFTAWNASANTDKLSIGFVSGDFCNHPVGYFLEGLLEQLDPSQFEIYAFATTSVCDELTHRIQPRFKAWIPLYGQSDRDAAAVIHGHAIHILIDLSGHTAHNRLPVFGFKPAPVQATWLGYFATTGLPEMDFLLGDPHLTPASETHHFTETVWTLPETWLCHKPTSGDVSASQLPALRHGWITLGSFGNLSKMNDQVVQTWAAVLQRVPDSQLLLKSMQLADTAQRQALRQRFEQCGIAPNRLILEGPSTRQAYFETYNRVDFVLDTFPYPGGTTSVDALWMGVPVLTLKGDRLLSHLGESIALNAGLGDWIAKDRADYVDKAVEFASDLERLSKERRHLQSSIQTSALFDTARFAKHFGDALWGMWHHRGTTKQHTH